MLMVDMATMDGGILTGSPDVAIVTILDNEGRFDVAIVTILDNEGRFDVAIVTILDNEGRFDVAIVTILDSDGRFDVTWTLVFTSVKEFASTKYLQFGTLTECIAQPSLVVVCQSNKTCGQIYPLTYPDYTVFQCPQRSDLSRLHCIPVSPAG